MERNGCVVMVFNNLLSSLYKERICSEDLERIKQLVANFYKIPKEALDKVKVKIANLPTIYLCITRKVGDWLQILYKPIGKILGLYHPEKKEIYIDKNIPYYQKLKALIHEYIHAAQQYLGKFKNSSRQELEEEAYKVSSYLFRIYNRAFRKPLSSLNCLALI